MSEVERVARRNGYFDALDSVCHFINSLDSGEMTSREVRSAIYGFCLEGRPPALAPADDDAEWLPIKSAPTNEPVRVRLGEGMTIVARLVPDASVNDEGNSCDQWQAEFEGEYPECWSDGCCWEHNVDGETSLQPTHWQPVERIATRRSLGDGVTIEKLIREAYEEGVEDGISWHSFPESGPQPQWIDSVARVEWLKRPALSPANGRTEK